MNQLKQRQPPKKMFQAEFPNILSLMNTRPLMTSKTF